MRGATTASNDLDEASALFDGAENEITWDSESLAHYRSYPEDSLVAQERLQVEEEAQRKFLQQVATWRKEGFRRRVRRLKGRRGAAHTARFLADDATLKTIKPVFLRGALNEFRITFRDEARLAWPAAKGPRARPEAKGLVLVTETLKFSAVSGRAAPCFRDPRRLTNSWISPRELVEGDFVVHLQHGIALYRGLTKLDTAQGLREVIPLEFDDKVTLPVPLRESHLISRYVGLSRPAAARPHRLRPVGEKPASPPSARRSPSPRNCCASEPRGKPRSGPRNSAR